MTAKDIMTRPAITANEDTALDQIARTMIEHRIGCLPIVDNGGRLTGIITESDFMAKEKCIPFSTFRSPQLFGKWFSMHAVEDVFRAARGLTARDIMTRRVETVFEDDAIHEIMVRMLRRDVNRIPVVRDGRPVGIVARHDLLKVMTSATTGN